MGRACLQPDRFCLPWRQRGHLTPAAWSQQGPSGVQPCRDPIDSSVLGAFSAKQGTGNGLGALRGDRNDTACVGPLHTRWPSGLSVHPTTSSQSATHISVSPQPIHMVCLHAPSPYNRSCISTPAPVIAALSVPFVQCHIRRGPNIHSPHPRQPQVPGVAGGVPSQRAGDCHHLDYVWGWMQEQHILVWL